MNKILNENKTASALIGFAVFFIIIVFYQVFCPVTDSNPEKTGIEKKIRLHTEKKENLSSEKKNNTFKSFHTRISQGGREEISFQQSTASPSSDYVPSGVNISEDQPEAGDDEYEAFINRASWYYKDPEALADYYKEYLKEHPDSEFYDDVSHRRANLIRQFLANDPDLLKESRATYQDLIENSMGETRARYYMELGSTYSGTDQAIGYYQKALEDCGDEISETQMMTLLRLGETYEIMGDPDRTKNIYQKAVTDLEEDDNALVSPDLSNLYETFNRRINNFSESSDSKLKEIESNGSSSRGVVTSRILIIE